MTIEPQELALPEVVGLDAGCISKASGTGIHVVIGPNNAGKTRLLDAIVQARFVATVRPADSPLESDHALLREQWSSLGPVHIGWPRDLNVPDSSSAAEGIARQIALDPREEGQPVRGDRSFWSLVSRELLPHLRRRPAIRIPTNRYFPYFSAMTGGPATLEAPHQWPALLVGLQASYSDLEREAFGRIAQAFRNITDGILLEGRLNTAVAPPQAIMRVVAPGCPERNLEECGDGLRDLVGILLYAAKHANHDLMLDEPGLRLHPHSQRRLMRYLESEARDRAIWIATHDGVFVGAPAVQKRFYVHRDQEQDTSVVEELLGHAETRRAVRDLGWEPADAFLADRILLCEGESDRIAFEAVKDWLVRDDIRWDGLQVSDFGGVGVLWSKDRKGLLARVRLVQGIAPHAEQVAMIDSDGRPEDEVRALAASLERAGLRVVQLDARELENVWLEPLLVHRIMTGLARDGGEKLGREVVTPSEVEVATLLASHDVDGEKGSDVLEAIARGLKLRFDKVAAAKHAVESITELAPTKAAFLRAELRRAFRE